MNESKSRHDWYSSQIVEDDGFGGVIIRRTEFKRLYELYVKTCLVSEPPKAETNWDLAISEKPWCLDSGGGLPSSNEIACAPTAIADTTLEPLTDDEDGGRMESTTPSPPSQSASMSSRPLNEEALEPMLKRAKTTLGALETRIDGSRSCEAPASFQTVAPPVHFTPVPMPMSMPMPMPIPMPMDITSPPLEKLKLKLVLDLDNTLLHAVAQSKCHNAEIELGDYLDDEGNAEMYKFILASGGAGQAYYLKLRPGVRKFLEELKDYYEMAVHTNATPEYADVIKAVIDFDGEIFGNRIAAREANMAVDGADPHTLQKDLNRLVVGSTDSRKWVDGYNDIIIVDDRKDVWDPALHPNVIRSDFYDYLESRRDQIAEVYPQKGVDLGMGSPELPQYGEKLSLSNDAHEELVDFDSQLFYLRDVLIEVYNQFKAAYMQQEEMPEVGEILARHRGKVLQGKKISLAGFTNKDEGRREGTEFDHPLSVKVKLSELGATVIDKLTELGATVIEAPTGDEGLTHLLMLKRQSTTYKKVWDEYQDRVKYCHLLWLYACSSQWRPVPEVYYKAEALIEQHYGEQRVHPLPHREAWRMMEWRGSNDESLCKMRNPRTYRSPPNAAQHPSTDEVRPIHRSTRNQSQPSDQLLQKDFHRCLSGNNAQVWSASERITLKYTWLEAQRQQALIRRRAEESLKARQKCRDDHKTWFRQRMAQMTNESSDYGSHQSPNERLASTDWQMREGALPVNPRSASISHPPQGSNGEGNPTSISEPNGGIRLNPTFNMHPRSFPHPTFNIGGSQLADATPAPPSFCPLPSRISPTQSLNPPYNQQDPFQQQPTPPTQPQPPQTGHPCLSQQGVQIPPSQLQAGQICCQPLPLNQRQVLGLPQQPGQPQPPGQPHNSTTPGQGQPSTAKFSMPASLPPPSSMSPSPSHPADGFSHSYFKEKEKSEPVGLQLSTVSSPNTSSPHGPNSVAGSATQSSHFPPTSGSNVVHSEFVMKPPPDTNTDRQSTGEESPLCVSG
eukprot:GHVN01030987.1.p1 GENE.GHVN01030987.1~~GHVN01030987.1.p1  ORF type:complete len:1014 (+),score=149.47 GHVN01030987.1:109-3150(+)